MAEDKFKLTAFKNMDPNQSGIAGTSLTRVLRGIVAP